MLVNKAFRLPRSRPPPGGRCCNRKIAGTKTDVFRQLFHTKTQKNTQFPSIFTNPFQPKIETLQFERPERLPDNTNKTPPQGAGFGAEAGHSA